MIGYKLSGAHGGRDDTETHHTEYRALATARVCADDTERTVARHRMSGPTRRWRYNEQAGRGWTASSGCWRQSQYKVKLITIDSNKCIMTEEDSELSAQPKTVQELVGGPREQYITPDFQRDFEWDEKQYDELWRDFATTVERNQSHFLGQVIVVNGPEKSVKKIKIIDGQQRITTIVVLLCAIRDIYKEIQESQDDDLKNQIEQLENLIYVSDIDGKSQPRVILKNNESTNENLKSVINEVPDEAEGKIKNCYDFFIERLSGLSFAEVDDIRRAVLTKVKLIKTSTGDINSAYQVFQTENDRGLDLSVIDLAKSITFEAASKKSSIDDEKIKNTWIQIVDALDEVSGPGAKRPITHILGLSKYKCSMDEYPNMFNRKYKNIVRSGLDKRGEDIGDLMSYLDREASVYYMATAPAVNAATNDLGENYSQRARRFRYKNPHAGVALYYLYKNYKQNEQLLYKILDLCIMLSVRLNLNDATQTSKRDPIYKLVRKLRKSDNPTEAVKRTIRSDTPSDIALEEYIKTREFKQNNITKLVLRTLEEDHFSSKQVRDNDFQIEHIAPRQSFSKQKYNTWRSIFDYDEGKFNQFRTRLGNLTILRKKQNARAGANPFKQKKRTYDSSEFIMTNKLLEYDEWGYSQIKDRSETLAELVIKSWSIE